jgi:hypothetical protein
MLIGSMLNMTPENQAGMSQSRPHRALGEKTPNEFAKEIAASRDFLGLQTAEKSR